MISLGNQREFFWDDHILNMEKTTAPHLVHHPLRMLPLMKFDKPWEGDGCGAFSIVFDPQLNRYRIYYEAWQMLNSEATEHTLSDVRICVIESEDGIRWERPNLGVYEFNGSRDNNIVVEKSMFPGLRSMDSCFVMYDENPAPVVPERYKATVKYQCKNEDGTWHRELYSLVSDDGIHFRHYSTITDKGRFDTVNVVQWYPKTEQYHCFIRDFHHPADENGVCRDLDAKEQGWNETIRDIRVLTSKDFIHWTEPQLVQFNDVEDHPLYTNCAFPYPSNKNVLVGLPTRYVERHQWTGNFDRLCGAEKRRVRAKIHPRYGLTVTDCLFMCSRDGLNWYRHDDAFMRPDPENGRNWLYGDCYPAVGVLPTPSGVPGADYEMSLYLKENHWMSEPANFIRYTLRWDGFVSMHAGIRPEKVVTKGFVFEGSELRINFETSARGWMKITLRNIETDEELHSDELFGNRINRIVDFDGDVAKFSDSPVVMEIELCDADIYAFEFGEA